VSAVTGDTGIHLQGGLNNNQALIIVHRSSLPLSLAGHVFATCAASLE